MTDNDGPANPWYTDSQHVIDFGRLLAAGDTLITAGDALDCCSSTLTRRGRTRPRRSVLSLCAVAGR
jgi:hypothetical protein